MADSKIALTGKSISLSIPRKVVCDLLHIAKNIPTVPVQRSINVAKLMAAREQTTSRISWPTIFAKAYAIVCSQMPELRRAYLEYPRPRLYEHPHSIASIAIERMYEEEASVFFAYIPEPECMTLVELENAVAMYRTKPVEELFAFTFWFYRRFPRFCRRFLWWYMLNVRGSRKAQFIGTFGLSVYSSLGAESLHPLTPLTTTMNYGIIDQAGQVSVRLIYDHRVMDGATIARALHRLEEVLNREILSELHALTKPIEQQTRGAA